VNWLLPPLRPTFAAALRDKAAKTERSRIAAAERLSEPDDGCEGQAIEALVTLVADENVEVRRNAVQSLGRIRSASTLYNLVERLHDDDPLVREFAIIAISEIKGDEADAILRNAVNNSYPEVRFQAVQSCVERAPKQWEKAVRERIGDDDPKVRAIAAYALGAINDKAAQKALIRALDDSDKEVRHQVAVALAKLGDKRGASILRESLSNPSILFESLQGLTDLKDTASADRIANFTQGFFRPMIVKVAAARALVLLGDARGVQTLREVLTAWRSEARNFAVQVVGELRIYELALELKKLARRPRGTDPEVLAQALALLAPKNREAMQALRILAEHKGDKGKPARTELARLLDMKKSALER
jgi:HEAT repeat protein